MYVRTYVCVLLYVCMYNVLRETLFTLIAIYDKSILNFNWFAVMYSVHIIRKSWLEEHLITINLGVNRFLLYVHT